MNDEIKKSALFTAKSDGAMYHTLTFSPRQVVRSKLTVLNTFTDDEGEKLGIGYPEGEPLFSVLASDMRAKPDESAFAVGDEVEIVMTLS